MFTVNLLEAARFFKNHSFCTCMMQVLKATLTSMHRGGMEGQLMDMVKFPLYFEYIDGEVGRIFAIESDSVFCTNIKKGILSLFQLQAEPGERTEVMLDDLTITLFII